MKNIDLSNLDEVINALEAADDAYFNSDKELMSDAEYDLLKRAAQKLSPRHPYFVKVGADVRGGKLRLPYPMNGLDQIFEGEIIPLWVNKYTLSNADVLIVDKLDGVSCLLVYADKDGDGKAEFQIAYSRGNSAEGADITRHVKQLDFPKVIEGYSLFVVRAEIIMKDKTFRDKYEGKYSSARALVAGSMNRTTTDDAILKDIDLIAYTVVDNSGGPLNKQLQLLALTTARFKVPFVQIVKGKYINDTFLSDCIKHSKETSPYELDGVVLTDDRTGQSIKYKTVDPNSVVTTKVKAVHWEISKWGLLKPRVEITPVKLHDTIVTFATGHNAKFIKERQIMPGSVVQIIKAGSVIPQIL